MILGSEVDQERTRKRDFVKFSVPLKQITSWSAEKLSLRKKKKRVARESINTRVGQIHADNLFFSQVI
jgi:hypothetical protein